MIHYFKVPAEIISLSLERYLAEQLNINRIEIRRWIMDGHVTVDGLPYKPRRYIQGGQEIRVSPPPLKPHPAEAQQLPIDICYEDDHLIVVSKPGGMATHPSPNWWKGSCVNALLYAVKEWPGIGGVAGPGIVHRLDKDTSGLLIFAKSKIAQQVLLEDIKHYRINRDYLLWIEGCLNGQGTINKPLGRNPDNPYIEAVLPAGKVAITHYKMLLLRDNLTLLKVSLETGRTHQIRVHMADLGHPVWGDKLYGQEQSFMALHAWCLRFLHPITQMPLSFVEPVPFEWHVLGGLPEGF